MNADPTLDTCGCCEGPVAATPAPVVNAPGLSALALRAGTHGRFKQTMLARLNRSGPLAPLTTRADDDPSIALIDAWAASLDVLTFYQERIGNEHYLRTATELGSLHQLARAIGYELAPGIAARTTLAYTLETAPGAPPAVTIPAGSKAQSVPAQDEKPQLFETSSDLLARAAWNALPARLRGARTPVAGQTTLCLEGLANALQPGDALLLVGDERLASATSTRWDFRRAQTVRLVANNLAPAQSYTEVTLERPLGATPAQGRVRVFALRQRAGLFGHNAPDWQAIPPETRARYGDASGSDWPGFNPAYSTAAKPTSLGALYLDNPYKAAVAGAWAVVMTGAGTEELYAITQAEESALAAFAIAGKSSKLTLSGDTTALVAKFWDHLRAATVFLQTDELTLAEPPLTAPLAAGSSLLTLDVALEGPDLLPAGRPVIVTGVRTGGASTAAERAVVKTSIHVGGAAERLLTRLELDRQLTFTYRAGTVRVLANVVEATHGETKAEVLGSGDGSASFQRFALKQAPLTYLATGGPQPVAALTVRVDGVRWQEAPSFHGVAPEARVYVVRRTPEGAATVMFGDGRTGARLPTGVENVTAHYRVGSGLAGLVAADQISLLLSRPLGVKEVRNPLPAEGADDAERPADARQNAPLTVLTLDRIVSRQDHEDFARAFPGIGKAAATLLWTGEHATLHLTTGLADGTAPAADSSTLDDLRAAIGGARHPLFPVEVQGYVPRAFAVQAKLGIDRAYEAPAVLAQAVAHLAARHAFAQRGFTQDVTAGEIVAALQGVPGVVFVDLDALAFKAGGAVGNGRLVARPARAQGTGFTPADLLTLAAADIHLTPISVP